MGLERLQQCSLSSLISGDRFYIGNNKKVVYEFIEKKQKSKFSNYEYFYKFGKIIKSTKKDKVVVYLRNKND